MLHREIQRLISSIVASDIDEISVICFDHTCLTDISNGELGKHGLVFEKTIRSRKPGSDGSKEHGVGHNLFGFVRCFKNAF